MSNPYPFVSDLKYDCIDDEGRCDTARVTRFPGIPPALMTVVSERMATETIKSLAVPEESPAAPGQ